MIYSKYLSGKYKNEIYFKPNVSVGEAYDDRCLFDLARGCRIVVPCADKAYKRMGETIYDIMSIDEAEELRRYLLEYGELPMAVSTVFGIAIAIPWLAPSSSLGMLLFPYVGGAELCRVAKRKGWRLKLSASVSAMGLRSSKRSYAEEDTCMRYWELMHEALMPYSSLNNERLLSGDITAVLEERVYALSYYTCCPVGLVCHDAVEEFGTLDFPLFTAFVLVFMMCARIVSGRSEISAAFEENSVGTVIRMSFTVAKKRGSRIIGVDDFRAIAMRKNLFFEYIAGDGVAHVRFSPISPDWSLLGLKSPEPSEMLRRRRIKRKRARRAGN